LSTAGASSATELRSRPLFRVRITLHPVLDLGVTPLGRRRVFLVSGGSFEGERIRGTVVPDAGSDWLLQRADDSFQLDVRMMLRTDDGALISMCYHGVRHASADVSARIARGERVDRGEYYLRTTPWFETADPRYAWINDVVTVGMGERQADAVVYDVFEVL
jgi:uncharacterized protein DUF3237